MAENSPQNPQAQADTAFSQPENQLSLAERELLALFRQSSDLNQQLILSVAQLSAQSK